MNGFIKRIKHIPMWINTSNGEIVNRPAIRTFIFTVNTPAEDTALESLRSQTSYAVRQFIIVGGYQFRRFGRGLHPLDFFHCVPRSRSVNLFDIWPNFWPFLCFVPSWRACGNRLWKLTVAFFEARMPCYIYYLDIGPQWNLEGRHGALKRYYYASQEGRKWKSLSHCVKTQHVIYNLL